MYWKSVGQICLPPPTWLGLRKSRNIFIRIFNLNLLKNSKIILMKSLWRRFSCIFILSTMNWPIGGRNRFVSSNHSRAANVVFVTIGCFYNVVVADFNSNFSYFYIEIAQNWSIKKIFFQWNKSNYSLEQPISHHINYFIDISENV